MEVWHGPLSRKHSKCLHVGLKTTTDDDVNDCKKECINLGCNAFTFDASTLECVLSKCSVSTLGIPDAAVPHSNVTSYLFIGKVCFKNWHFFATN